MQIAFLFTVMAFALLKMEFLGCFVPHSFYKNDSPLLSIIYKMPYGGLIYFVVHIWESINYTRCVCGGGDAGTCRARLSCMQVMCVP